MKVGGGTREVSCSRWPTSTVTLGISSESKSEGRLHEKSEEVIVPMIIETTQLDWREGPLLQPSQARR